MASRALSALAAVPDAGPVAAMFRMRRGAALFGERHPLQQAHPHMMPENAGRFVLC